MHRLKVAKFQILSLSIVFTLLWQKEIPAHLKLTTKMPTLTIFELKQRFRKSVEYFLRYRIFAGTVYILNTVYILLAQCTFPKFQMVSMPKFSRCHWKSKIPAHLKLFTQIPTLYVFKLRQRFRKSVEYRWTYRIFAGTVYRLKVGKLKMLLMRKVFTMPLQK